MKCFLSRFDTRWRHSLWYFGNILVVTRLLVFFKRLWKSSAHGRCCCLSVPGASHAMVSSVCALVINTGVTSWDCFAGKGPFIRTLQSCPSVLYLETWLVVSDLPQLYNHYLYCVCVCVWWWVLREKGNWSTLFDKFKPQNKGLHITAFFFSSKSSFYMLGGGLKKVTKYRVGSGLPFTKSLQEA